MNCKELSRLTKGFAAWGNRTVTAEQVYNHIQSCPTCQANKPLIEEYDREWTATHPQPDWMKESIKMMGLEPIDLKGA